MDRQDIRSVLRLFAEIASSIHDDAGSAPVPDYPDASPRSEECMTDSDADRWAPSGTAQG